MARAPRSPLSLLPLLGLLSLACLGAGLAGCSDRRRAAPDLGPELGPPRFPGPPPREPGPPRPETAAQIEAAAREASELTRALVGGGVPGREAASVADMRGYRLYRRRLFGQARAWFRAAVTVDATFELSLFNAARCAALLGDLDEARRHLARLRGLTTPIARARVELARTDPDLAALR